MQSDFNNVETELRDIEEAFASGRMNAFGSASTQDAFVHELKRIAEIETQVFYRTCALLKSSSTNEHALTTNMYASAQPPPQSQRSGTAAMAASGVSGDASFRVGSGGGLDASAYRGSASQRAYSPFPSAMASGRSGSAAAAAAAAAAPNGNGSAAAYSPGVSRPQSRHGRESFAPSGGPFAAVGDGGGGGAGPAPHIRQGEWGNEDGFADRAFEDVAAHFEALESQFFTIGDYLRDISKHVLRLNDMSEQVNNGVGHAGANNNGSGMGGNDCSNSGGGAPPTMGALGRQEHGAVPFGDGDAFRPNGSP